MKLQELAVKHGMSMSEVFRVLYGYANITDEGEWTPNRTGKAKLSKPEIPLSPYREWITDKGVVLPSAAVHNLTMGTVSIKQVRVFFNELQERDPALVERVQMRDRAAGWILHNPKACFAWLYMRYKRIDNPFPRLVSEMKSDLWKKPTEVINEWPAIWLFGYRQVETALSENHAPRQLELDLDGGHATARKNDAPAGPPPARPPAAPLPSFRLEITINCSKELVDTVTRLENVLTRLEAMRKP